MDSVPDIDRKAMHYTADKVSRKGDPAVFHSYEITQAYRDGYRAKEEALQEASSSQRP